MIAIRDTPHFPFNPVECLAEDRPDCSVGVADAVSPEDPILVAARHTGVRAIDLTDAICGPDRCAPVVGNVVVYRDNNHLTATYVRMLASVLAERAGL